MRHRRNDNKYIILLLVLFTVSIGYAALSTTLKINGTTFLTKNTWNVKWNNIANQKGITPKTEPTIGEDENHNTDTLVTFGLDLTTPGDYFEFTVDAVNTGTIDAKVNTINKNGIPDAYKDVIDYKVTYENLAPIKVGDRLDSNTKTTYKVSVKYRDDINKNQIIGENIDLNLTLSISYDQADASNLKKSQYSMYSWDDLLMHEYYSNDVINLLETYNIGRLYQCVDIYDIDRSNSVFYNFTKKMHDNGISLYMMFGDPSFYSHPEILENDIDQIVKYNNSVDNSHKVIGVLFDIEPYGNENYNDNVELGFKTLVETYEEVAKYAHEKGIEIAYAIPSWYDTYANDSNYSQEFRESVSGYIERIIKSGDVTSVMNYSKANNNTDMDEEVALAKANNRIIESVSEFGPLDETPNITYYSNEHPIEDATNAYKTMFNKYKYQNLGFSYHHMGALLMIINNYDVYRITFFDVENNSIITDSQFDYYENNQIKFTGNINWRGFTTLFTKNNNFVVKAKGYDTSTITNDKIENDTKFMTVNHTGGKISYQIEMYASYTDDTLPSGQICVTEVGSTEDHCHSIYGPNDYKLIFVNKVFLNTKYNIYHIDDNNVRHELATCEYQLGSCKNSDGTFSIDTDYNNERYIGLSLFFNP